MVVRPAWRSPLGVRSSRVHYNSADDFITAANPDDSGSAHLLQHQSRLPGSVWHAADNLNLYVSYGQGFETPTFAELAYNPVGPGLNFNLNPATSTAYEVGLKWLPTPSQRLNLAFFTAQTKQEIVVNTATGGRTTYANAGRTRRRGVEAEWDADLGYGVSAHVNYTWLLAQFADAVHVGHPAGGGARRRQAARGALAAGVRGAELDAGRLLRLQCSVSRGSTWARCTPTIAIPPSPRPIPSATCKPASRRARGTPNPREYVRVNNVTNVKYVGSVIVGDTNGRYFEPAPGRNWFVGASVAVTLVSHRSRETAELPRAGVRPTDASA